jgi:hypothetical protein
LVYKLAIEHKYKKDNIIMSNDEKREIQELIDQRMKENGNGITRKVITGVLIGLIPLLIVAGIGSYQGVMQAEHVNRQNIKNNKEQLEDVKDKVLSIEDDQLEQWKCIIECCSVTRGDADSNKKE